MNCPHCAVDALIYVRDCVHCAARFCASLPTAASANETAERWAKNHRLDPDMIKRLTRRLREMRFQKALRAGV